MPLVNLRISNDLDERLEALIKEGKFRTKSDLIRTAIIEWLKDRELKIVYQAERRIK